ncbi:hypothetical protein D9Q98_010293 [Chlorella vulgaris]|uniref:Uncharacterized protein n=1 Tax=Chlorella vulgaris TaxID=3077 RepID=A0A9D4TJX1_CHLVU|nr:hypothetical protein D9Q98_010293 [Chlorella vulgaris]
MFAAIDTAFAAAGGRWQPGAPPAGQVQPACLKAAAHARQQHQRRAWQPATTPHRTTVFAVAAAADGTDVKLEMVMRRGKSVPVSPDLAAGLAPLAAACGVADMAALARAVAALPCPRQQGTHDHGLTVAAYLQGLGVKQDKLGRLLCRCPVLFSWPSEGRGGVLFSQLMRLGLSAGQAACCFVTGPAIAGSITFEPAIAVLSPLLAAGCKVTNRSGEQLLGDLLKKQPAGAKLLKYGAQSLQRNVDNLLQLGLSKQQLVDAMRQDWALLTRPPERLAKLEAVLQQELGADRQLWVNVLRRAGRTASCSEATLRQQAQALVAEFGKEEALRMVGIVSQVLAVDVIVWRQALAVWRLCGVADPLAVLGGLQLLVADKRAARQEWRLQQGRPGSTKAAGEPGFISVFDVAFPAPAKFAGLVQHAEAWLSEDSQLVGSGPSFDEFSKGLKQLPAWQRLWADAGAAVAELKQQLPPELLRAGVSCRRSRGDGSGSI